VDQGRFERALHDTRGLGHWRRDIPLFAGITAITFAGLQLLGSGEAGTNVITALLVGFGVMVVLPLFELIANYLRAPKTAAPEPEPEPVPADLERERYESLRDRLGGGSAEPKEGSGPE
jgi:hypothetical protein